MLAFTLIFIYIIFFGIKWKSLEAEIASITQTWASVSETLWDQIVWNTTWIWELSWWETAITTDTVNISNSSWWTIPDYMVLENKTFFSVQSLFWNHIEPSWSENKNILLLRKDLWQWKPGIPVAEAGLKSLESVGIQDFWKYILKDMDNTHYVYLGKQDKNILKTRIEQVILPKWWNILEISDKNRIKQDQLIGDEVWNIITPYAQKKRKVLLIVFREGDGDTWFLQIDKEILDRKKKELQDMFGKRYHR